MQRLHDPRHVVRDSIRAQRPRLPLPPPSPRSPIWQRQYPVQRPGERWATIAGLRQAITHAARHSRQEGTLGTSPTDSAGISPKEEGARRATVATTSTVQKTNKGGINLPPRNKSRRRNNKTQTARREQTHNKQPYSNQGTR